MNQSMNHRPLSADRALMMDSCINQSRTNLFYHDEANLQNQYGDCPQLNQEGIVETRKFKLEIEDKFIKCDHNRNYLFPRDVFLGSEDIQENQQGQFGFLQTAPTYNLYEQNLYRQEAIVKMKKSRSEFGVGLFKQALQGDKGHSRQISKSKPKEKTANKPCNKFRRIIKDKQNNLNFQNLREDKDPSVDVSINKSKSKLPSPGFKPKQMTIPRIDLAQRETPKCFRDLGRLDHHRK